MTITPDLGRTGVELDDEASEERVPEMRKKVITVVMSRPITTASTIFQNFISIEFVFTVLQM